MAKNIQNIQKPTKKEIFLKALKNNLGHITRACESANIHRQTYYSWIDKDEGFKQLCEDVEESLLDMAEHSLLSEIKDYERKNHITAVIFFLKTKGRKRGYNESTQLELVKPISEINFDEL
tara:strand:+ start:7367 stop:7729 length:363 start_codon:yes stop_codon:yes gene_type:complete